jgi:hypothetical protein
LNKGKRFTNNRDNAGIARVVKWIHGI